MNEDLAGLVAVVTGGSAGIGAAVTSQLSASGASVAVLDLDPSCGQGSLNLAADVADDAGIGAVGTVIDNEDDEWLRALNVNVIGTVRTSRACLPHLRESASAAIVNTASVVATVGLPDRALYSSSKGTIAALTRAMAADHLGEGIRVNCVSPGTADIPWVQRLLDSSDDPVAARLALEERQPHGRLVTADEVATTILYLASSSSGSTTGADVLVDGGLSSLRLPVKR